MQPSKTDITVKNCVLFYIRIKMGLVHAMRSNGPFHQVLNKLGTHNSLIHVTFAPLFFVTMPFIVYWYITLQYKRIIEQVSPTHLSGLILALHSNLSCTQLPPNCICSIVP